MKIKLLKKNWLKKNILKNNNEYNEMKEFIKKNKLLDDLPDEIFDTMTEKEQDLYLEVINNSFI